MSAISGRLLSPEDVRRILRAEGRAGGGGGAGAMVKAAVAVATGQLGVISRPQLLTLGFSSAHIKGWLRDGRLHRVFHGIYLLGHPVPPPGARELGALLAAGEHSGLRLESAAAWWGLGPAPAEVQVLTTGGHRGERQGIRARRGSETDRQDIVVHRGLPVTSIERTMLDLAAARHGRIEQLLADAHAKGLLAPAKLAEDLDRRGGQAGRPALVALTGIEARGYTRSDNERRLRMLCRAAGLPQPRTNVVLHGWEVDFFWPDSGLVVEVDAFSTHGHRAQYHRDRRKQNALVAAGHPFLRYTGHALHHEPLAVIAALARMVGAPATRRPAETA